MQDSMLSYSSRRRAWPAGLRPRARRAGAGTAPRGSGPDGGSGSNGDPGAGARHRLGGRLTDEGALRSRNSRAKGDGQPELPQRQLDTAEGAEDLELVERAEVTDAEELAFDLAEADAERQSELLAGVLDDGVRVERGRDGDGGEGGGVAGTGLAEDAAAGG